MKEKKKVDVNADSKWVTIDESSQITIDTDSAAWGSCLSTTGVIVQFDYNIGDRVGFVAGKGIDGVVVGLRFIGANWYEVSWFNNGSAYSQWFRDCELEKYEK